MTSYSSKAIIDQGKRPSWWKRMRHKPLFIRLFQWEYWPSKMFYWPMYFYVPWLQIKAGHPCFFSAANPGIDTGGIGLESKYETILKIPEAYRPASILAKADMPFDEVSKQLKNNNITYPLIAKPDLGYRGFLVTKVHAPDELQQLLRQYPTNFVIQELIKGKEEFGVFYHRMPNEEKGTITSLTLKEFLSVTGNGKSTVEQLIVENDRAHLQLERLREKQAYLFDNIPGDGEVIPLGIIGNHSKGTRFINGAEFIDEELINTIDSISQQIDGFYFGRFDIKCSSLDDLKQGKNIHIIEVNGTCSEPTHIYDPTRISYFGALREIVRYWDLIYKISKMNRQNGASYTPAKEMAQRFIELPKYFKRLRAAERRFKENISLNTL